MNITSEHATIRRPASSAVPPFAAPTRASVTVDLGVGESLTNAALLRLLDRLRRELSRQLVGTPGAFIGYDSLALPRRAVEGPDRILVTARMLEWTERLHCVEYLALSTPSRSEQPAQRELVLARGMGRTLHVDC